MRPTLLKKCIRKLLTVHLITLTQALYDCYLKLGPILTLENKQLLAWEMIMVRGGAL